MHTGADGCFRIVYCSGALNLRSLLQNKCEEWLCNLWVNQKTQAEKRPHGLQKTWVVPCSIIKNHTLLSFARVAWRRQSICSIHFTKENFRQCRTFRGVRLYKWRILGKRSERLVIETIRSNWRHHRQTLSWHHWDQMHQTSQSSHTSPSGQEDISHSTSVITNLLQKVQELQCTRENRSQLRKISVVAVSQSVIARRQSVASSWYEVVSRRRYEVISRNYSAFSRLSKLSW